MKIANIVTVALALTSMTLVIGSCTLEDRRTREERRNERREQREERREDRKEERLEKQNNKMQNHAQPNAMKPSGTY